MSTVHLHGVNLLREEFYECKAYVREKHTSSTLVLAKGAYPESNLEFLNSRWFISNNVDIVWSQRPGGS